MDTIREIFSASDSWCEVSSAWAFSMDQVFLYLDMASEDADLRASALVRVTLEKKKPQVEVLQSLDFGALDYHAASPNDHWLLVSGNYIHRITDGEETFFDPISDLFLRGIVPMGGAKYALFGEDGAVYSFENGNAQLLDNPSDEEMLAAHFPTTTTGFVCGTYGALVKWDGSRFEQIDLGGSEELQALHLKPDGTVLIGLNDGTGIVYRNDEIIAIGEADGGIEAITTFKGEEYWGDDDFGIYTRKGNRLVEKFETEGAFKLNCTESVMTTVVGSEIYMFDGEDWKQLHVNKSVRNFVSQVPLDFTPL